MNIVIKYCPACGKKVKPNINYCPFCGQKLVGITIGEGNDSVTDDAKNNDIKEPNNCGDSIHEHLDVINATNVFSSAYIRSIKRKRNIIITLCVTAASIIIAGASYLYYCYNYDYVTFLTIRRSFRKLFIN